MLMAMTLPLPTPTVLAMAKGVSKLASTRLPRLLTTPATCTPAATCVALPLMVEPVVEVETISLLHPKGSPQWSASRSMKG